MYPNTQESLLDSYIVERGKGGGGSHMTLCFVPRSDDGNNSLRVCVCMCVCVGGEEMQHTRITPSPGLL